MKYKTRKIKNAVEKYAAKKERESKLAYEKAKTLSNEEKDQIQAVILQELTLVVANRIRLMEKVLDRKVDINTSYAMDDKTLTISLN